MQYQYYIILNYQNNNKYSIKKSKFNKVKISASCKNK